LRILHVDKFLPPTGGVGSVIATLSAAQRREGHEVFAFGCTADGQGGMPRWVDFTRTRSPLALARMIHNREAAEKLEAFLRRCPVDVAHLHNIYHHLTPSILPVLARRRIGVVMTVHDYRLACPTKHFLRPDGVCYRCRPNRFYHAASPRCAGLDGAALALESTIQRLLRRYARGVDVFCCPSYFLAETLWRIGTPADKVAYVPNPVEPPAAGGNVRRQRRGLLFAGRLSAEKGAGLMLDLAAALGDATVVIAGDGPEAPDLRTAAQRRKLRNVRMVGRLDRDELAKAYARAAAVVLTSRWPENSPMTMLEAMAAGRCVIAPAHPPLREWITDRFTGRLFAPDDAADLARVAGEVLADPDAADAMGRAAAERVRRRHAPQAVCRRLDERYEQARRRCALRW